MAVQSILNSTKKTLSIAPDDPSFDIDIIMHINSIFSVLNQLGIGPVDGYMIEDSEDTWDAFIGSGSKLNLVKTYVYLRVRMLFDPPGTSFFKESMEKQIAEFEWRLSVHREGESWVDPTLPVEV